MFKQLKKKSRGFTSFFFIKKIKLLKTFNRFIFTWIVKRPYTDRPRKQTLQSSL